MNLFQIIKFVFKRQPGAFSAAVLLLLIGAVCELLGLASLLPVATELFQHGEQHLGIASTVLGFFGVARVTVNEFLLLVIASIVLRGGSLFCAYVLIAKISTSVDEELSGRTIDAIIRARWSFILDVGTAKAIDATTRQTSECGYLVSLLAPFLMGITLSCIFLLAVAYFSPYSLLVSGLVGAPLLICLRKVRKFSSAASNALNPLHEQKSQEVIELFQNAKYVKVSGLENKLEGKLKTLLSQMRLKQIRLQTCTAVTSTAPDTLVVTGVAILIGIINTFALDGGTNFLLSLMLMYRAFHYLNQAQSTFQAIHQFLPSISRLQHLVTLAEAEREIPDVRHSTITFEREIKFEGVTFGYQQANPVLKDFSVTIRKNEFVPIRGRSGSGKTTLIDLLVGLHLPQAGKITIDGIELTPDLFSAWRKKIAYIPQEPPVFDGTIRDNLLRDNSERTDAELLNALRLACADELIPSRSGGLDSPIGDRGLRLSGGQRQRLLIARALLRDVELMILDEPTSAVDPEAESILFARVLEHIKGKKTLIVVTHRGESDSGAVALQI